MRLFTVLAFVFSTFISGLGYAEPPPPEARPEPRPSEHICLLEQVGIGENLWCREMLDLRQVPEYFSHTADPALALERTLEIARLAVGVIGDGKQTPRKIAYARVVLELASQQAKLLTIQLRTLQQSEAAEASSGINSALAPAALREAQILLSQMERTTAPLLQKKK